MENDHAINGKTHYFYGHFQQQTVKLPEGNIRDPLDKSNLSIVYCLHPRFYQNMCPCQKNIQVAFPATKPSFISESSCSARGHCWPWQWTNTEWGRSHEILDFTPVYNPLHPLLIIISPWFNSKFDRFTIWLVVLTCSNHVEKYESQWGELSHVLWKTKIQTTKQQWCESNQSPISHG